ncbi:hypothetical protein Tco_0601784 [Tanacetum coccineum]
MSSVKAKIVAATGCCANILWMKSQLSDYDIHYKMVPIFCDNTSSIAISNNPVLHSRTKHIDIRFISCALEVLLGAQYTQDENFRSLLNILSNSNFSKDASKFTEIELTASMIVVNSQKDSVSPLPFFGKKKKVKSQTRNIQLTGTGFPSTSLDEGIRKSQPLPESTTADLKDFGGKVQPAEKGIPSMDSDKGTVKTMLLPEGPRGDKDSEGLKPPTDMEPLTNPIADLLGPALLLYDDEMVQKSDKDDPESSHAQEQSDESDSDSSCPDVLKKYDNILPLTERQLDKHEEAAASYADLRASDEDYYDENVDHMDQTDKLVKETMKTLDNISKARMDERAKLLKALTRVSETLEADSTLKESASIPTAPQPEVRASVKGEFGEAEPQVIQRKGKGIATGDEEFPQKHVPASTIIQYLNQEAKIKKKAEEARLLAMTKSEIIKVVYEEVEKARIDLKIVLSAKGGEQFKKIQDAEHQVHKRLRPEPIINVKIHPNSKPAILIVYRENHRRNFQVHNPFKFADFGVTELDELALRKIPKELGIQSALPAPKQAPSQSLRRKRKHMELEPEIKVLRLECNHSLPEGVPFVNNMVIEEPEYGMFFIDDFGDQAFQRMSDINKVRVDSLLTYLVMALNITTPENTRFCLKLRKLVAEHPDQEKLQSKKVKLESVGYKLD